MAEWMEPEKLPWLSADELQVWRLDKPAAAPVDQYLRWLTVEEKERAERFRHDGARWNFVAGRAALRFLLGAQMGVAPGDVELTASAFGKLGCEGGSKFNVAHSGGVVLIALAAEGAVGVDVEQVDPSTDIAAVGERMFTPGEVAAMGEDREAFFQIWALKEALLKADGRGLSLSSQSFEVPLQALREPEGMAAVSVDGQTFHVQSLPVGGGFAGAVATQIPARLRLLRFPFAWLTATA